MAARVRRNNTRIGLLYVCHQNIDVCHKGVNAMIHDVVQSPDRQTNNNDKIRLFREIDRIISNINGCFKLGLYCT